MMRRARVGVGPGLAVPALALLLAGCAQPLDKYAVGTWSRSVSVPTQVDPYTQQPVAWCTQNDHTLELKENGTYVDVQALSPRDVEGCDDPPNAITWTRGGEWVVVELSDDGEVLLVLTQRSEVGEYDGPRDDEVSTRTVETVSSVSIEADGEDEWLRLSALGLFQRVGE